MHMDTCSSGKSRETGQYRFGKIPYEEVQRETIYQWIDLRNSRMNQEIFV